MSFLMNVEVHLINLRITKLVLLRETTISGKDTGKSTILPHYTDVYFLL